MAIDPDLALTLGFALCTSMGMALFVFGRFLRQPYLVVFSGFVWVFGSVAIFPELGAGWAILGLGLGLMLLYTGGADLSVQKA